MRIRNNFLDKWKKYLKCDDWEKFGGTGFRVWGHGNFPFVVSLIPNKVKDILELGCADGYMLHLMKEKGMNPVGLTYSDGEKQCCSEKGLNVIVGDMHDLPFEDNVFDAVIARQTLEHALSHIVVLLEINRVLKKDGYIILHLPHADDCKEYNGYNEWHFCQFNPAQWKYFLKRFGFEWIIEQGFDTEQYSWWIVAQKTKEVKN